MIARFDHLVLAVDDLTEAERVAVLMLGRAPSWRNADATQGTANVVFRLANVSLELIAAEGEGETGARLRSYLEERGPHLASLAFNAPDIAAAYRRCQNNGLDPSDITPRRSTDRSSGRVRSWRAFRANKNTHGVRLFFLDEQSESPTFPFAKAQADDAAIIQGLDHLVIRTPNPDRAAALYGARLGLDLRMDRHFEDWGARLMFFRVGDAILEVAHDVAVGISDADDALWGVTWRVDDVERARARLLSAGLDVSDVRVGRKPGTRVATLRSGAFNVPTLLIDTRGAK